MTHWGVIAGDRKTWVRDIVFTAAMSLVFSFLAPGGQNGVPLQERVMENFALGFASMVLLWPPMRLALRLGDRAGLPELFVIVAGLVVLTLPVALISRLIVPLFPHGSSGPPASLIAVYFVVLPVTLPVGVAYLMIERRLLHRPARPPPASEAPTIQTTKLLGRLPARLGGEVLALQGEDHYVRVHTALGSELLLMRMGDAIAELGGLPGERVHRSWWVAREAVKGVRPTGRRLALTLSNGLEVPVTREASTRLRQAGWLKA
jgi:hypothetical protein